MPSESLISQLSNLTCFVLCFSRNVGQLKLICSVWRLSWQPTTIGLTILQRVLNTHTHTQRYTVCISVVTVCVTAFVVIIFVHCVFEGKTLRDVEKSWVLLERAEHERERALQEALRRLEYLEQLAQQFGRKVSSQNFQRLLDKYKVSFCFNKYTTILCIDCFVFDSNSCFHINLIFHGVENNRLKTNWVYMQLLAVTGSFRV